jgi:hypothetical protein
MAEGRPIQSWANQRQNPLAARFAAPRMENEGTRGTSATSPTSTLTRAPVANLFGAQRPTSATLAAIRTGGRGVGRENMFPAVASANEIENNKPVVQTLVSEALPDNSQAQIRHGDFLYLAAKRAPRAARYPLLSVPVLNAVLEEVQSGADQERGAQAVRDAMGVAYQPPQIDYFARPQSGNRLPQSLTLDDRFVAATQDEFARAFLPIGVVQADLSRNAKTKLERQFEVATRGRTTLPPVFRDPASGKYTVQLGDNVAFILRESDPRDYSVRYNTRGEVAGRATQTPFLQLRGVNCGQRRRPSLTHTLYESQRESEPVTLRRASVDPVTGLRQFPRTPDAIDAEAAGEGFGVSYRPRALLEVAQVHHVGYVRDVQGSDQAPERADVLQALRLTDRWALLHERTQIEVQLTM